MCYNPFQVMGKLDAALNAKHARIVDAFRIMDRRGVGALEINIQVCGATHMYTEK
jgi:hypothetical protein